MEEKNIWEIALMVVFPLFWWGLVRTMAHLSGWRRIAARFQAGERKPQSRKWGRSAKVGWASYNGCVSVNSVPDGIHLAVMFPFCFGHKPIFIPREEIRDVRGSKILWIERVRFEVGSPKVGRIELARKDFEGRDE